MIAEKKKQFKVYLSVGNIDHLSTLGSAVSDTEGTKVAALVLGEVAHMVEVIQRSGRGVTSADFWGLMSRISEEVQSHSQAPAPLPEPARRPKTLRRAEKTALPVASAV